MAINNINDAWQGKSGKEVREVIQRTFGEKVASTYFDPIEMKLYGFKSVEDRDAYIANGDASLIIDTCPFSFTGTQNRINILDKQGSKSQGWLVKNEKFWRAHKRTSYSKHLLFTTRKC
jgi:hypothetical protein